MMRRTHLLSHWRILLMVLGALSFAPAVAAPPLLFAPCLGGGKDSKKISKHAYTLLLYNMSVCAYIHIHVCTTV